MTMRYFLIATLCLGSSCICLGQASTMTVTATATFDTIIASAGVTLGGPSNCVPATEPNNYGTVSISMPGTNSCTETGEGVAITCTSGGFVTPGNYTLDATYSGFTGTTGENNSCQVPGATASTLVVVPRGTVTTTVQLPSSLTLQAGETLTLPVTVTVLNNDNDLYPTATGNVSLMDDSRILLSQPIKPSGPSLSTATISASTKGVAPGQYSINIAYNGDPNYLPASSNSFTVTILPAQMATTSVLSISPNPLVKGDLVTLGVSITPSGVTTPTGSVTIVAGSASLATIAVRNGGVSASLPADVAPGTYNVQALYSGDSFNLPSTSSPVSVTVVAQTATTTNIAVTPTTIIAGRAAQISTSVTPQIGNSKPTGTVTITANGQTVTTLPLQDGAANLDFSAVGIPTGTYNVVGTYSGSATDTSSTSAPQTVVIVPASTLALTASPNPVKQGTITTLTAVVKTGVGAPVTAGTITFTYAGNSLGTANLNSSGNAQLPIATSSFAAGTYAIQASYPGATNIPAATGTVSLVVN